MNHPIHLSTAQLWKDVSESVEYRIGICIIGILLRQGISGLRHGELPLDFIEYHSCPLLLYKMIQVWGKDRRHPDVSQAKHILGIGLALVALLQKLAQPLCILMIVSTEI